MKPVVIIVVSVVCSVVAVLGVLIVMDMYAVSEAQKAYAIEMERQEVCEKLYDNTGSLQDIELWGICINYGIVDSINSDVELCGSSQSYSVELCKIKKELEMIRIVEQEITLDQDFRKEIISHKSDLESYQNQLWGEIQEKKAKEKAKSDEKNKLEKNWVMRYTNELMADWNPIYQECMNTNFDVYETTTSHDNFCKNTLGKAMGKTCPYIAPTCRSLVSDIVNGHSLWSTLKNKGSQDELFSSYSKSCKGNLGSDYKECMCSLELVSYSWVNLCKESLESNDLENEQHVTNSPSEIKTGTPLTKEEIMSKYRECLGDGKNKSECAVLLRELSDKRCKWITNSPNEYDFCMSDMSVFR
jgi:hypothetical protein